ncbi:hypothetical protein THH46_22260 [Pseudomonas sp. NA13]
MKGSPEENGLSPASTHGDIDMADGTGFAAWARVWAELGVVCPSRETYEELIRHYGEPHRAYHNLQHLKECLQVRRFVNAACQACAEIDLALWFHDVIYDPFAATTNCAVRNGWTTWHVIVAWAMKRDAGFTT